MSALVFQDKAVTIVAYAETKILKASGLSAYQLAAKVSSELFQKSGLSPDDIDGFATVNPLSECTNPFWANYCSDALGISANWMHVSSQGGASALSSLAAAVGAVAEGRCQIVMQVNADAPSTRDQAIYGGFREQWVEPTGLFGPPGAFGLVMNRYDTEYGLDHRALGKLLVEQRQGAIANDNAYEKFRRPISIDDYLNAKMISEPLSLFDSVMPCDGANGFIVMSTDDARTRGLQTIAYPVAYSEVSNPDVRDPTPDLLQTGHKIVGPAVMRAAGLAPDDVDMVQLYDDFLIAELLQLEQLGFCSEGEGCQFLLDTDLGPTGDLPINTGGGLIGAGQTGLACGGLQIVEALRQLAGEGGERQVPGAGNGLITGLGVIPYGRIWGTSNCMILTN